MNQCLTDHPLAGDLDYILEHTRPVWDALRNQCLFITGGTGFYGTWLLESLIWADQKLQLGLHATVLSRNPPRALDRHPFLRDQSCLSWVTGDVRNFAFPSGSFPFVIHAATEASEQLNREQPLAMIDTIVEGTRRALDFAAAAGTRHFLHTSSGAVYGDLPHDLELVSEDFRGGPDPTQPKWTYGEGKRLAELLCAIYDLHHNVACKNARCFANVGPRFPLDIHFAIGNFIRDALSGRDIVIRGDGTPVRSYIYIADLIIWLWHILVRGQRRSAYNVGSERGYSIADLARLVSDTLAPGLPVRILGQTKQQQFATRYVPSVAKARAELGLETRIPLDEAIRRTAVWEKRRPS